MSISRQLSWDTLTTDESPVYQGTRETFYYAIRVRGATSVLSPACKVFDGSGTDVTATVMPTNTPAVTGLIITLSALTALDASAGPYSVVVTATVDTNLQTGTIVVIPVDESLIGAA